MLNSRRLFGVEGYFQILVLSEWGHPYGISNIFQCISTPAPTIFCQLASPTSAVLCKPTRRFTVHNSLHNHSINTSQPLEFQRLTTLFATAQLFPKISFSAVSNFYQPSPVCHISPCYCPIFWTPTDFQIFPRKNCIQRKELYTIRN